MAHSKHFGATVDIGTSQLTIHLLDLKKQNLLARKPTKKDGRELQVYPTKAAKEIHQDLDDIGRNLTKLMRDKIGKDDLAQTVAKLRKVQKFLVKI